MNKSNDHLKIPDDVRASEKLADYFETYQGDTIVGGVVTFAQPESIRGAYAINRVTHYENWNNELLVALDVEQLDEVQQYRHEIIGVTYMIKKSPVCIKKIIFKYKSGVGSRLSLKYDTLSDLRGNTFFIPEIGTITSQQSELNL